MKKKYKKCQIIQKMIAILKIYLQQVRLDYLMLRKTLQYYSRDTEIDTDTGPNYLVQHEDNTYNDEQQTCLYLRGCKIDRIKLHDVKRVIARTIHTQKSMLVDTDAAICALINKQKEHTKDFVRQRDILNLAYIETYRYDVQSIHLPYFATTSMLMVIDEVIYSSIRTNIRKAVTTALQQLYRFTICGLFVATGARMVRFYTSQDNSLQSIYSYFL